LTNQLIQLLPVENPLALALKLERRGFGQRGLIHNTTANTAASAVGRSAGASDAANVRDRSRHLGRFLVENLGNRQLGVKGLRRGLDLRLRVRVRMTLLLMQMLMLLGAANAAETQRRIAWRACGDWTRR
jgi:hypothetical protein